MVAQLAGGVAAALLVRLLFTEFANAEAQNYGAPAISDRLGEKVGLGMLAEFIGTFFLVWAIAGSAVNPRGNKDWAALTIGLTLGLGALVFAPLTGAALNPARAFGPSLVADAFGGGADFLLAYVLAPILGGLAAAFIYVDDVHRAGQEGRRSRARRVMEPSGGARPAQRPACAPAL